MFVCVKGGGGGRGTQAMLKLMFTETPWNQHDVNSNKQPH